MYVLKRDGRKERVMFDKITARINKLAYDLDLRYVETALITQKVISGVFSGVKTTQLDNLAAETAAYLTTQHPDYAILAARIAVSNLHKETKKTFSLVMADLYNHVNPNSNKHAPLISKELYDVIQLHADRLNSAIIYDRDYAYNYFGFKTLEKSYLMRIDDIVVERPQHMLMRVALGIHLDDVDAAIETYNLLSEKWFTHATPTLFNAGTPRPQMSSCFLVQMQSDSIEGIYDTVKTTALISKSSGGLGIALHKIRASGSYIAGTGGSSNGLIPMLRVFNDTARFVTQGGGKRNGSFAVYLEPWHADIMGFLDLRKNTGVEEARTRDLFLGLWIPDLFMERVEQNTAWSLFCPAECPGLHETVGAKFKELYEQYERQGRARKVIKAQELWFAILDAQIETGQPYMLYKDACNLKSNQQNLGVIQCSNLCTEIVEYTAPDEVAVCNLASIALPKFVNKQTKTFDFQKLFEVTKVVTVNLNKIIDRNWYPVEGARRSNMRHRPVGLGVQGFADALIMMRLPFEAPEAAQLNVDIFETIYFGAMTASMELAKKHGPYETYAGSPVSQGKFQFDLWGVTPASGRWDWAALKAEVAQHGVRNSLLVAPMPTASTAQILGNNESFEPYTSNIYSRRVMSGEFQVVNHHLLRDLTELGLWDNVMRNRIIANNGSIQAINEIPKSFRDLYKTAWEVPQRRILDMAADRSPYIDQSQSLNVFMSSPTAAKLTSMHFHGWKRGLKTGMYYLRTKAAVDAIKFTVDQTMLNAAKVPAPMADKENAVAPAPSKGLLDGKDEKEKEIEEVLLCSRTNKDECLMCSS